MWDATIAYQQAGEFDTTAMYNIYQRMNPKLTFQDIANVFSGVYADTYWNVVQMDYQVLAKSMISALGVSRDLANSYSQKAISQWRGAFCRNNISDVGNIPSPGNFTQSLDIVCNNDTELIPVQLIQNWNNEFYQQPQVGKNYVYTRCQNVGFYGEITPKVRMYFTSGGFNQPPSSWQQLFTATGTKAEGDVILIDGKPGPMDITARGASESFFFVCLIGVIGTSFFSNPLDIAAGNWNSTTWITWNGAACWHNVNPQVNMEENLKFYNQDGTTESFTFHAQCRNVPVGSKISLRNDDPNNPNTEFNSGLIEITNPSQTVQIKANVPAYYEGNLKVHMEGPDGKILSGNSVVELTMLWNLTHGRKR